MKIHYCQGPADAHTLQGLGPAFPGALTQTVSSSGLGDVYQLSLGLSVPG